MAGDSDNRFLRACWRETVDATPVWFMRQAGRFLPGYRDLRQTHGVLDIARNPELSCQVALEPIRTLGVDAAILFADIALPVQAMGFPIDIEKDVGPVTTHPIRTPEDVGRVGPFDPDAMAFIPAAIRRLREKVGRLPIIGFCGAPFTLASYLIEGRPSKDFAHTKAFMWGHPDAWRELMGALSDSMASYLRLQVEAGADAVQVFDSWAGGLSPDDYARFAAPHTAALFRGLRETGVPSIHFGTGTSSLIGQMRRAGGEVIGVDWRLPIDEAWRQAGNGVAIQGNLDPAALLAPPEAMERMAVDVLRRVEGQSGHIFNLGHGVLPGTPVDHARRLVQFVHSFGSGGN